MECGDSYPRFRLREGVGSSINPIGITEVSLVQYLRSVFFVFVLDLFVLCMHNWSLVIIHVPLRGDASFPFLYCS